MSNILSQSTGYVLLTSYGFGMLLVTYLFGRWRGWRTKEGFLLAERRSGWVLMGPSIAASWIWAGALFVSVQVAFEKGLAGLFWFIFPNFIALAIFLFLGPKIREKFPSGYTLPQYIRYKLKDERVHKLYLLPFLFGQLIAVTFNIFAGGVLVATLTGIPATIIMPILVLIVVCYALISGLEASIATDFLQMILIYTALAVIIPWVVSKTGTTAVLDGLGGIGDLKNIFDAKIALGFGIVTSIGLISQTITDQQYWQRVFATKRSDVAKAFIWGAVLFAIVPTSLALLGFLAANPSVGVRLPANIDPSMIGVLVVNQFLPSWTIIIFVIALLSGLTSTVDSAMAATSSLYITDIRSDESNVSDSSIVAKSRISMLVVATVGLAFAYISYFLPSFGIQQMFLLSISIAASTAMPTILSLYWENLSAKGVFVGILAALIIGMPSFFYADYTKNELLTALSSLFMISASTIICLMFPKNEK